MLPVPLPSLEEDESREKQARQEETVEWESCNRVMDSTQPQSLVGLIDDFIHGLTHDVAMHCLVLQERKQRAFALDFCTSHLHTEMEAR